MYQNLAVILRQLHYSQVGFLVLVPEVPAVHECPSIMQVNRMDVFI